MFFIFLPLWLLKHSSLVFIYPFEYLQSIILLFLSCISATRSGSSNRIWLILLIISISFSQIALWKPLLTIKITTESSRLLFSIGLELIITFLISERWRFILDWWTVVFIGTILIFGFFHDWLNWLIVKYLFVQSFNLDYRQRIFIVFIKLIEELAWI